MYCLVDYIFLYSLLRPPNTLNVGVVHCFVGVFKVDPTAHPVYILFPLALELKNRVARRIVKSVDAYSKNIFFVLEAELFLDQVFYRQALAVPPPPPRHAPTTHCLVARYNVFDYGGKQRAMVREPCGKWRPIVKNKISSVSLLFKRLFKNPIILPKT